MRSQTPVKTSGSVSFAKPGSMPEVKQVVPPASHAAWRRATTLSSAAGGKTSGTTDVATTFAPEARIRHMSSIASDGRMSPVAVYETQSGSSARSASTSLVALTPVAGKPTSRPASWPTLAGLCTQSPTSSRSGCEMMPWRASLPTLPVLHCTTR